MGYIKTCVLSSKMEDSLPHRLDQTTGPPSSDARPLIAEFGPPESWG